MRKFTNASEESEGAGAIGVLHNLMKSADDCGEVTHCRISFLAYGASKL